MQKLINGVTRFLWSKKFWVLFGLLTLTALYIYSFKGRLDVAGTFSIGKMIAFSIIAIVVLILFGIIYHFATKKKLKFEQLFLLLAIPLGIIYLIITPSFAGSDDRVHFFRAYELSEGVLLSPKENGDIGGKVDSSLITLSSIESAEHKYEKAAELAGMSYTGEQVQAGHASSALYSPTSYLPITIGLKIGSLLHLPPYALTVIGRVFNLLFYIAICYFGFKILPRFKLFFLILMVAPIALADATTFSADGFLCSLVFLFTSAILHFVYEKDTINKKWTALFWILSGLIAGCKVIYFPIILGVLFIKKTAFKSKKQRIIFVLGCAIFALLVGVTWMKIAGGFLSEIYPDSVVQEMNILKNPFRYLAVLVNTLFNNGFIYAENLFSSAPIYNSNVVFSWFISMGFVVLGVLSLLSEKQKNTLTKWQRTLIIALALAIVVLVCTALYVQWTVLQCGLDCGTITGIQGRYFIPALMLAVLAFGPTKKFKFSQNTAVAWLLVFQAFSILTIIQVFAA